MSCTFAPLGALSAQIPTEWGRPRLFRSVINAVSPSLSLSISISLCLCTSLFSRSLYLSLALSLQMLPSRCRRGHAAPGARNLLSLLQARLCTSASPDAGCRLKIHSRPMAPMPSQFVQRVPSPKTLGSLITVVCIWRSGYLGAEGTYRCKGMSCTK
jgi:hypothetical protein